MGIWSGVGSFFKDHGDDILVGAASVAGFAVGGPIGAAAVGAAVGGITSLAQGESLQDAALSAGFAAVGGLAGGMGSFGVRGLIGAGRSVARAEAANLAAQGGSQAARDAAAKLALNRPVLGWLPTKIGGAHLTPGSTYLGLFGAATAPSLGNFLEDSFRANVMGYPAIPLMDISDEDEEWPAKMAHVYMPDPSRMPPGLTFNSPMQQNYRTLPPMYKGLRSNFGKDSGETDLPKELDIADISGDDAAHIPTYSERVDAMREQYGRLRKGSEIVAEAVHRSAELCGAGRSDIDATIEGVKGLAGTDPRDIERINKHAEDLAAKPSANTGLPLLQIDTTQITGEPQEDAYVLTLIETALAGAEALVTAYGQAFQNLAAETEAQQQEAEAAKKAAEEAKQAAEEAKKPDTPETPVTPGNSSPDPYYQPAASGTPTATTPTATTPGGNTSAPPALDLGDDDPATTDPGIDPGRTDTGPSTSLGGDSGGVGSPTAAVPALGGGSGLGSGFESMMLPQLMQAMLGNRGPEGNDRSGRQRNREEDERHGDVVAAPGTVPSTAPAAAQPPAVQSNAPAAAPARAVAPPAGPAATPPAAAPARTSDDNVVYTFPDGRTQEVSATVARVLDAAFGNAAKTDARQAYEGTPAAWPDAKRIGTRIDPYQVITGDIGVWEERTAVLVVVDESADGSLEAVIDGALQVVHSLAEMRDSAGEFGGFTGFFHPPGIEKKAPATETAPVADATGDQSAPVVASA
ncbi:hypothetical protein [Nocardia sp. NPDC003963]